jgi:preprotein translocase subunit SecF
MTKIPLDIDARPLVKAIEQSKQNTMTHIIMTHIAEALAVVLMLLLGAAILSL